MQVIVLLLLSNLFYIVSCYVVMGPGPEQRPAGGAARRFLLVLGAALIFRVTIWPLYPGLSDDVFRYRWEGKLQAAGENPYAVRPASSGLRDETFAMIPGRDFRAVYGPLTELVERATWRVVASREADPFRQAFWFKVPAALFDLGAIGALWLLLQAKGLPAGRVLVYAWSPLPVVEFWGSGHNDSIVLCLLLLALAAAVREKWTPALAALGLAIAAKLWPVFLLPLFLRPKRWRQGVLALAIFALLAFPYRMSWPGIEENARFLSGFLGGWRNNDSLFGVLLWLARGDFYLAKKLAGAAVCLVVVAVTARRWPLERAVLAVTAALLMVSANCHPWYLTWILPLLALYPIPALLLWTCLAPLAHAAVITWAGTGEWQGSTGLRYYEYVPVYALLVAAMLRMRSSGSAAARWPSCAGS